MNSPPRDPLCRDSGDHGGCYMLGPEDSAECRLRCKLLHPLKLTRAELKRRLAMVPLLVAALTTGEDHA